MSLAATAGALAIALLPVVALAQNDAPQSVPVGRWLPSKSASGFRTTDVGIELRRGEGWFFTSAVYADFALDLEFRIHEPGTRAKLFIRAWPGERPSYGSYSVNLSDALDGTAALGSISFAKRDIVAGAIETAARRSATQPLGQWQQLQVSCEGKSLHVRLNGTWIDRLDDVLAEEGVLGLASDGGSLELRGLAIRELGPPPLPRLAADPERGLFQAGKDKTLTDPKVVKEVKPNYVAGAMVRKVQGAVSMQAVVLKDGTVGEVRVTRPLDRQIDRSAIATLKEWRFTPALKDGTPVEAIIEVEMSFTLK